MKNKLHQKEKLLYNSCFLIGLLVFISIIVLWTPTQNLLFQQNKITSNFLGMNGNPSKNKIFNFYLLLVYLLTNISCFIVFLYIIYSQMENFDFTKKNPLKLLYLVFNSITILTIIILFILNPKSTISSNEDQNNQFSFVNPLIFPFLTISFGIFCSVYFDLSLNYKRKGNINNVLLKSQQLKVNKILSKKNNDGSSKQSKIVLLPKKKTKKTSKKQKYQELEQFE
jgi:4-amino-4-deoxy-L-arabinose transferase-like glycosyltransferase